VLETHVIVNTGGVQRAQETDSHSEIFECFWLRSGGPSLSAMYVNRKNISSGSVRQPNHDADQWHRHPGPEAEQIRTSCVCLGIQLSTKASSITADGGMACHHGEGVIHDAHRRGQRY